MKFERGITACKCVSIDVLEGKINRYQCNIVHINIIPVFIFHLSMTLLSNVLPNTIQSPFNLEIEQ